VSGAWQGAGRPAARAAQRARPSPAPAEPRAVGPSADATELQADAAVRSNPADPGPRIAARRKPHGEWSPPPPTSASPPAARTPRRVADLEFGLTRLLRDVDGASQNADARRRAASALAQIAARLAPPEVGADVKRPEDLLGSVRELLARPWQAAGALRLADEIDEFGRDPGYVARARPVLEWCLERYFQVDVEGIEHVPTEGAAILVCNRGGVLPWDGVILATALRARHPAARVLRWLTEDFVQHAPFLGATLNRLGAARACQENAERLLRDGQLLAVFPEGEKGVAKLFRERYRLQRFGRGGYVKLALRTRVPLLPVAIVGAEESYPLLHRVSAFSRALGVPFVPVTPLFPWLGPLGLVPLPSRWRIVLGPPVTELLDHPASVADDAGVVNALSERVRATLQRMLDEAVARRGSRLYAWPGLAS
jgi:1-acyl-sn-glycerol-3-phosphate acyltransferase